MDEKARSNAYKKRVSFSIVALATTLLFALGFWFHIRQSEELNFFEVSKTLTDSSNQSIKLWLEQQRRLTQSILISSKVEAYTQNPHQALLKAQAEKEIGLLVGRYPQLYNIQVLMFNNEEEPWLQNGNGEFKLNGYSIEARPLEKQKSIESTGAAEAIVEHEPYYISGIYSDENQKPIFDIAVPILKEEHVIGILNVSLNFSSLTDVLINQIDYKQTGYLFLVDDSGRTIAHRNSQYVLSNAEYLQDIVNKLLTHLSVGESHFRGNFQGANKLYYGVETGLDKNYMRNQWYLVFTQKESEIYQLSRDLAVTAIAFMIIQAFALVRLIRTFKQDQKVLAQHEVRLNSHELLQEEIKQKHDEAIRQTNLDAFTQISHFQSVQRVVERLMYNHEERPLTVALFHLDRMGLFNEQYGLTQGDMVIYYIGKLLREHFGEPEYVGRVYGDVFAILLPDLTLIEAIVALEQFRKVYDQFELVDVKAKPSISFGIVQWHGESSSELILKAEHQLKKAKKAGTNQMKYWRFRPLFF